ncbi:uncharacterized protein LAESUDRAFT_150504 [Laetiporus sulphureus 93-53]|uniref:Uncharacterized protein n=1 Tax=Laetiporus sulphureus 93-53 TaxID=1314785 RepID=A0A165ECR6_9APHY|nr:uncharacterized protein LAESUDRAFT_150504 [Laetiporus sulphureus 93-53]KZT06746.1 hypothetical protein LAESUDRAFT_150504 [Laetiporus sulphureus 93-53]
MRISTFFSARYKYVYSAYSTLDMGLCSMIGLSTPLFGNEFIVSNRIYLKQTRITNGNRVWNVDNEMITDTSCRAAAQRRREAQV